jgi:hypothetical protein
MKKFVDLKRTERHYSIGDWIYLKLQSYHQISLSKCKNQKLGPRYYDPFEIKDHISTMVYRLYLLSGSFIQPVIHISQLKKHLSRGLTVSPILIVSSKGQLHFFFLSTFWLINQLNRIMKLFPNSW